MNKYSSDLRKAFVLSFTHTGNNLARKIASKLSCSEFSFSIAYAGEVSIDDWIWNAWSAADIILFIGHSDKIIRSFAPYVSSPNIDPSVILIDDSGKFVVPFIKRAYVNFDVFIQKIVKLLNATFINTQETVDSIFDLKKWINNNHLILVNPVLLPVVENTLRQGESVSFSSFFPIIGDIPPEFENDQDLDVKIYITNNSPNEGTDEWNSDTLYLIPNRSYDFVDTAIKNGNFSVVFKRDHTSDEIICGEYH